MNGKPEGIGKRVRGAMNKMGKWMLNFLRKLGRWVCNFLRKHRIGRFLRGVIKGAFASFLAYVLIWIIFGA